MVCGRCGGGRTSFGLCCGGGEGKLDEERQVEIRLVSGVYSGELGVLGSKIGVVGGVEGGVDECELAVGGNRVEESGGRAAAGRRDKNGASMRRVAEQRRNGMDEARVDSFEEEAVGGKDKIKAAAAQRHIGRVVYGSVPLEECPDERWRVLR